MECSGGLHYMTWFWMGCVMAACVALALWTILRSRDG